MITDHDPGDEQTASRELELSYCPFCRTITYYEKAVVERARRDGLFRVHCQFCKLFFWPGPVPTRAQPSG